MTWKTIATTVVHVDPAEAVGLRVPTAAEEALSRPTVDLPGDVHVAVTLSRHDAGAAAWWRQVAATAELAAQWYDQRTPGGAP